MAGIFDACRNTFLFVFDGENRAPKPVGLDVAVLQPDNFALDAQPQQIFDGGNFNKIADVNISGRSLQQNTGGAHIDNMRGAGSVMVLGDILVVMGDGGYNRRHIDVITDAFAVIDLRFAIERDFTLVGYHAVCENAEYLVDHIFSKNKSTDGLSMQSGKLIRVYMQQTARVVIGSNIGFCNRLSRFGTVENDSAVFKIFHFYHRVHLNLFIRIHM